MRLGTDDRPAIPDPCARACQALNCGDPDGYAALFTADGVFQRQAAQRAGGQVTFRHQGHDQLRAFALGVITRNGRQVYRAARPVSRCVRADRRRLAFRRPYRDRRSLSRRPFRFLSDSVDRSGQYEAF
jgi:hypothetical protein